MKHGLGEAFASRYDAFCPLCGQPWRKGARIACYKLKPGKRNPMAMVGEYAHEECARKYLAGEAPKAPEPVEPESPQEPEAPPAPAPENPGSIDSLIKNIVRGLVDSRLDTVETRLREALEAVAKNGDGEHYKGLEITVHPLERKTKIDGAMHESFEKVLKLVSANKPCLMVGPSGCGKSHLAKQVADALGLDFAFISFTAGISEAAFFGRLLPVGTDGQFSYVESDFIRLYENGGLFLLDELDAADPNTLLSINAALANGHCAIPNRPGKTVGIRHPNFRCIATANTFGTGADFQFVGRNQLDDASIDRFRIGIVPLDYDVKLEKALCPEDEIRETLQGYRAKIRAAKPGIRRTISTRFLRDAYEMKMVAGWGLPEIKEALFAGWSPDERAKVEA